MSHVTRGYINVNVPTRPSISNPPRVLLLFFSPRPTMPGSHSQRRSKVPSKPTSTPRGSRSSPAARPTPRLQAGHHVQSSPTRVQYRSLGQSCNSPSPFTSSPTRIISVSPPRHRHREDENNGLDHHTSKRQHIESEENQPNLNGIESGEDNDDNE